MFQILSRWELVPSGFAFFYYNVIKLIEGLRGFCLRGFYYMCVNICGGAGLRMAELV